MDGKPAPKRKGGRKPKLDPELVAAALAELHGNVAATAKRFNVHRSSVQELIGKRPSLQRVCADAREGLIDHAESALLRSVIAGEAWAVCFTLKTQGRHRGYVERQEVVSKKDDIGADVRKRLDEVDGRGPGQPGETGGGEPPGVGDPAPPAAD